MPEHPGRQRAVEGQRHPCGQQRVPSEERHEPRGPGGDDGALRVCLVHDPQSRQVCDRLLESRWNAGIERYGAGHRSSPARELADVHGPRRLERRLQGGRYAVRDRLHRHSHVCLRPAAHGQPPSRTAGRDVDLIRGRVQEHRGRVGLVVRGAERPRSGIGSGLGRDIVSADTGLDVEDVGEVGPQLQIHVDRYRLVVSVPERELLDEAAREPASPDEKDLGLLVTALALVRRKGRRSRVERRRRRTPAWALGWRAAPATPPDAANRRRLRCRMSS